MPGTFVLTSQSWSTSLLTSVPSTDASKAAALFRQTSPWLALLVVVIVVGWIVILFVRRWLRAELQSPTGFTLDELRQMHRRGEISDDEFKLAKTTLLEQARAAARAERDARKSAGGDGWEESGKRNR